MSSRTSRYAAATSTLALLVALGGTSYAATQIGTKQIKNNAVTTLKIKNETVTGVDVKESTLGQVPSAKSATSATNATSSTNATHAKDADTAASVNGVTPSSVFLYTQDSVVDRVVYSGQGLTLTASCDTPSFNLDLIATTSKSGAFLSAVGVADSNPGATIQVDAENSSFQAGVPVDLLLGDDGDVLQVTFTYSHPDGTVVTGTLATDVGNPVCSVRGTVFASPPVVPAS